MCHHFPWPRGGLDLLLLRFFYCFTKWAVLSSFKEETHAVVSSDFPVDKSHFLTILSEMLHDQRTRIAATKFLAFPTNSLSSSSPAARADPALDISARCAEQAFCSDSECPSRPGPAAHPAAPIWLRYVTEEAGGDPGMTPLHTWKH